MLKVKTRSGDYDIAFCSLREAWQNVFGARFLITDENVAALYASFLSGERPIVLPPGEPTKSLQVVDRCLEQLAMGGANRQTTIVAFGGGVIGDTAGLVAALYMRGVAYVQIPTTLLAQVDSSIGGKVGVDLRAGKNLAGAFYPPSRVVICIETLRTLDDRQFNNGMAEVWKYGFISDAGLVDLLSAQPLSSQAEEQRLQQVVERCITIKKLIVEEDEFEMNGSRATLNFGHTIGHGLETLTGYSHFLHGEAISIGMVAEAQLGEELGYTESGTADTIRACLDRQGLPTALPSSIDRADLINVIGRDKKRTGDGLAFSFVSNIGKCKLVVGVPQRDVEKVLNTI